MKRHKLNNLNELNSVKNNFGSLKNLARSYRVNSRGLTKNELYDKLNKHIRNVKPIPYNHTINSVVKNDDILKVKFGLFYHATGTGKTCQIITTAGKFHKAITDLVNILVVLPNPKIKSQFYGDFIKTCPIMQTNFSRPFNPILVTLNELPSVVRRLKPGKTIIFYDEVQNIKSVDNSINNFANISRVASDSRKKLSVLSSLDIVGAYAMTATPILDSPSELVNILNTMASLAGVNVTGIKNLRSRNTQLNYTSQVESILNFYRERGALLSFIDINAGDPLYPNSNLSESYFNPYTNVGSNPVRIPLVGQNVSANNFKSKNNFNRTSTLAWSTSTGSLQKATNASLKVKLPIILEECQKYIGKSPVLIYTKYTNQTYGVPAIRKYLEDKGVPNVESIVGGESNTTVEQKMKRYNSPGNANGSQIQVMIISQKMATGFNFRNTQCMILVEPDYNPGVLQQAMGRIIRKKIFNNGRGNVKIYGLLATSPQANKMTVDEQIYFLLKEKLKYIREAKRVFERLSYQKIGLPRNVIQTPARAPRTVTQSEKLNLLKKKLKLNSSVTNATLKQVLNNKLQNMFSKINKLNPRNFNKDKYRKAYNLRIAQFFNNSSNREQEAKKVKDLSRVFLSLDARYSQEKLRAGVTQPVRRNPPKRTFGRLNKGR